MTQPKDASRPNEVSGSPEEMAREVSAKLDDWIQENRRTGLFPGNGHEGQAYLTAIVADALHAARERAIDDALAVADRFDRDGHRNHMWLRGALLNALRALKESP